MNFFIIIAILPSNKEWPNGILLPIGIVFEHRFNKNKTPGVYADIVVAKEIAQNIEVCINYYLNDIRNVI